MSRMLWPERTHRPMVRTSCRASLGVQFRASPCSSTHDMRLQRGFLLCDLSDERLR